MHWKLLTQEGSPHSLDYLFDWQPRLPLGAVLEKDGIHYRLFLPDGLPDAPVLHISWQEYLTYDVWALLFQLAPTNRIRLARYSAKHSELPKEIFPPLYGQRPAYKAIADWEEYAALDDDCLQLLEWYDLPLSSLRLFQRFPAETKEYWMESWNPKNPKHFRRNIISDIIYDMYDLPKDRAAVALNQCRSLEERLQSRMDLFAERARDVIRSLRQPTIETWKSRLREIKKRLPRNKALNIEFPDDFETGHIRFVYTIEKPADIQALKELAELPSLQADLALLLDLIHGSEPKDPFL